MGIIIFETKLTHGKPLWVVGVVWMAEVISVVEVAEVNKVVRVVEVIEVIRVVEVIKVVELVERKNKRLPHFKREAASKFLHLGSRSEGRKARRADFPSSCKKTKEL